mmetsp:Transcript_39491/g.111985  ORF Transcript_39491/g.111985 Transcript_39491/m.111985 type:complete len:206 (+) Transcript_39491:679-1296(+)
MLPPRLGFGCAAQRFFIFIPFFAWGCRHKLDFVFFDTTQRSGEQQEVDFWIGCHCFRPYNAGPGSHLVLLAQLRLRSSSRHGIGGRKRRRNVATKNFAIAIRQRVHASLQQITHATSTPIVLRKGDFFVLVHVLLVGKRCGIIRWGSRRQGTTCFDSSPTFDLVPYTRDCQEGCSQSHQAQEDKDGEKSCTIVEGAFLLTRRAVL